MHQLSGTAKEVEDEELDPIHSMADRVTQLLYTRLYQPSNFFRRNQNVQRFGASALFYLRRMIRKLGLGKIPIRIVFIAQDPADWWSVHSLYLACVRNRSFKVYVLNVGFSGWLDLSTDCSSLFQQHGIRYFDCLNKKFPVHLLNPDIIVLSSPYDNYRAPHYCSTNLLRYGKLVYITYGVDFADRAGVLSKQTYGFNAQRNSWRIFTRSEKTVHQYALHGGVSRSRIIALGLPIIDRYYQSSNDSLPPEIKAASNGKFKILYNPHHTIEGWSTFLQHAPRIRRFIDEHSDCFLIFRPHPGLGPTLKQLNLMSEEQFRAYFSSNMRSYFDDNQADYWSAFRWSDILVSDASSFLVQYAPTQKPVIYLSKEDGWGIDLSLRDDVLEGYYIASCGRDLALLLTQLKSGHDPLAAVREERQQRMSVGVFTDGAGRRIADYLQDRLA